MRNALLTVVIALSLPASVRAGPSFFETGNSAYGFCKTKDVMQSAMCLSWVNGVIAGARVQSGVDSARLLYCLPAGGTNAQYLAVYLKAIEDSPNLLHNDAADLLLYSLTKAFPCASEKK